MFTVRYSLFRSDVLCRKPRCGLLESLEYTFVLERMVGVQVMMEVTIILGLGATLLLSQELT